MHRVIPLPALHEVGASALEQRLARRARSQATASELIVINAPRARVARRGRADAFGAGTTGAAAPRDSDCSAGTSQRHAARPWQGVCW